MCTWDRPIKIGILPDEKHGKGEKSEQCDQKIQIDKYLMRSTARVSKPSKVIASGVRKPGPPSPARENMKSNLDTLDLICVECVLCYQFIYRGFNLI